MNIAKSIILKTALLTSVFALAACGSSRYIGKVIPGSVGRPIIVSTTDDRINNSPGIPGLEVTLYNESQAGQAPTLISRTVTDEEGDFSFSIPSDQTPRGAVIVRVTGDKIYSARSKVFLPRNDQLMLFTVVTREPMMGEKTTDKPDPTK